MAALAQGLSAPAMLFGPRRTIYLLSPQPWDGIKVSKHHYAAELAGLGHQVFFIEPPRAAGPSGEVQILPTDIDGVRRVSYRPWFPYWIKFRSRMVFDHGMRRQARMITKAIGDAPDIVWDFDNAYQFADLTAFGPALKIFHPVDELVVGRRGDKNADLLLAVSQHFLDALETTNRNLQVLSHGLNREYAAYGREVVRSGGLPGRQSGRPLVGYVGHLDHPDFDWPTTFAVIEANPAVDFVFIGPFSRERDGVPTAASKLEAYPNCRLTGLLSPKDVLGWADQVDVWTLIFHCSAELGGRINSHKLLEYLATGKVIVTTKVLPYVGSDLFVMASDHTNRELPALMERTIANLAEANAPANQLKRCAFALEHSYLENLRKVEALISRRAATP